MGGPADRKAEFLAKIKAFVKPGDVINFDSTSEWYNMHILAGYWSIRRHQKALFGSTSRWRDTHTMLMLAEDELLSVEQPRTRWARLENLYDDKITVWRYTKRELSGSDIDVMREAAEDLIGSVYDVGQLTDLAVKRVMGYPHSIEYCVCDFSRYCKVCSVGVRVCYEHLRKKLKEQGDDSMKRLFSSFRYDTWDHNDAMVASNTECRGVDLEATTPAHFANSRDFDGEFELVCEFHDGIQIFPVPDNAHHH